MNESDIDLHKDSIDPSINGESILDSIPVIHSDESSRENEYDEFVLHSDEEFKLERSEILESLMYKTDDIELIGSESIYTTANNAKTTNNHACVNEQSIQTDQSYADFNQIPKELVNSIRDLVKAELRAESNTIIIHHGIECFYCKTDPIVGVLYCCPDCNFNICEECEDNLDHEHPLYKIKSAAGSRKRSESFSVTELIKKPIIQLQQEFKNQQPIQIQSDVSGAIYKRPTGKEIQKQLNQLFELGFSDKVQCITAIVKSNYDIDRSVVILLNGL